MKHGNIICSCGQLFYFESNNDTINCPSCGMIHNTASYPEKIEEPIEEVGEEDGTDI